MILEITQLNETIMNNSVDVCIIGSGAGGGPVAYTLANAGYQVLVLEKGPWFTEKDFFKDEVACCRRSSYTPDLRDERHVIEQSEGNSWTSQSTYDSGWDFWNGNCVGGSSNFMSGFFHRLKPKDFRLASATPKIDGANTVDWPISYEDMEPYYTQVERIVGISGRVESHPFAEPRSTSSYPYPPTIEHPLAKWIDRACTDLDFHPLTVPRAILSRPDHGRGACQYSGYCGSYGCASGAKGSSRAALLNAAVATGKCEIIPHAKVFKLSSDASGKLQSADYYDEQGKVQKVRARLFVVACQAIETSRLLLASTGPKHPHGLANRYGQVGKNLLFSAGGSGNADLPYSSLSESDAQAMKARGPFINRALQDWYYLNDSDEKPWKGGTIEFLFRHPNAISRANALKRDESGKLVWGSPLKTKLKSYFSASQHVRFETFCDWLPNDNCFVSLDSSVTDKWGSPVAKVRVGNHPHDLSVGRFLEKKAVKVLEKLGCVNISAHTSGSPPANLVAGGCRFGNDPSSSVLNKNCQAHDVENLYVTDGSFMPTGGSVPYTWTIYANAFRVADIIVKDMGGPVV